MSSTSFAPRHDAARRSAAPRPATLRPDGAGSGATLRIGHVSTYPPTQCGLATFAAALAGGLDAAGDVENVIVRLVEADDPGLSVVRGPVGATVVRWTAGDAAGMHRAAAALDSCDAVVLQHEFGVYGGPDGEDVLALMDLIAVPTIVVLHTVLTTPSEHQREVLERVVAAADAVVTMTETARDRLRGYDVDRSAVRIIAHGAPAMSRSPRREHARGSILTWGLLGPGKGIEWAVEAVALLADLEPAPRYVVAGQTHPKVLAHAGEAYRRGLEARVAELGTAEVEFVDRYLDPAALAALVGAADVVLLPYDSLDQVTSGVLIEAVASGTPVVATAFPHAVELLAGGAGLVVPHRDPVAMAAALRTVLTRPDVATGMSAAAAAGAPDLLWPAVAARYRALATELISARIAA